MNERMKKEKGIIRHCAGWLCLLLFLASCTSGPERYEHHLDLEDEVWEVHQMLPFEFQIPDSLSPYLLSLHFRYTEEYPYQDIFLFLQTTVPDGSRSQDTLHADLFSPEGKPLGKGHRVKEITIPYSLLQFPRQGKYVMRYLQGMRTDSLRGVVSFGVSLERN